MKHCTAPCSNCPFSRAVAPGALGGSPVETFIGQAYGPFVLPCHKACDFSDPDWKAKAIDTPQCAGAAIFRANVKVAPMMPPSLHALPEDKVTVFASAVEFYAHHKQVDIDTARAALMHKTPFDLCREQLARPSNILFPVGRTGVTDAKE